MNDIDLIKVEIEKRKLEIFDETERQNYMSWCEGVLYALSLALPNSSKALNEVKELVDSRINSRREVRVVNGLQRLIRGT